MPVALLVLAGAPAAAMLLCPLGLGVSEWRVSANGLASFVTPRGASVPALGPVMLRRQDPTASPALVDGLAPIVLALAARALMSERSLV